MELVGLCYSAVRFLSKMHEQSSHPHSGVKVKVEGGETRDGGWGTTI